MAMMLLGLVLFLGIHVVSSLRGLRATLIEKLGLGPYRGFYSLLAISGLLLTAYGFALWRAAGPTVFWEPPMALRHVALLLMLFATIAIVAAYVPSHIRSKLKHPLLVGVKTWAVYDRISLKRRDQGPPAPPKGYGGDILAVAGGLVLYVALAFLFHPYVIGVPVM